MKIDCINNKFRTGGGVLAPQFLGLGSGLTSPYGVGVGGVGLPAFGALTLTPASPALRALTAPPLPLATVLLVSNLNEEVSTTHIQPINSCLSAVKANNLYVQTTIYPPLYKLFLL